MRETLYIERPPQTLRKQNNMQFDLNRKWKANEAQLSPKLYCQLQTQHPTNIKRKSHILNQLHLPSIHDWKTVSSQVSMDSFKCINPPGTKGFGTHTKHQGGESKRTPQYLKNEKCYKPETFGGVRSIL